MILACFVICSSHGRLPYAGPANKPHPSSAFGSSSLRAPSTVWRVLCCQSVCSRPGTRSDLLVLARAAVRASLWPPQRLDTKPTLRRTWQELAHWGISVIWSATWPRAPHWSALDETGPNPRARRASNKCMWSIWRPPSCLMQPAHIWCPVGARKVWRELERRCRPGRPAR